MKFLSNRQFHVMKIEEENFVKILEKKLEKSEFKISYRKKCLIMMLIFP
jgi:hypothetical protein